MHSCYSNQETCKYHIIVSIDQSVSLQNRDAAVFTYLTLKYFLRMYFTLLEFDSLPIPFRAIQLYLNINISYILE